MSSWSTGSRGKTLVSLATTSKVLPVFSDDEFFLGNLNYSSCNNNNSDAEFIKITQSCVINQSHPNNITNLESGLTNSK